MISLISIARAAESTAAQAAAHGFVDKINKAILFPLIALMSALAFLYFLYGAFEYVKNASNETARETGRNHLMYGVIGMLVMLSAYAILNIAAGTFGLQTELQNAKERSSVSPFAPTTAVRAPRTPVGNVQTSPVEDVPTPNTPAPTISIEYAYVMQEMVQNNVDTDLARQFASTIQYVQTEAALRANLEPFVQNGSISVATSNRIIQQKFGG